MSVTTGLRILLDRDKCSGLGLCEAVSPDVFEVGDDGHLRLLAEQVDPARRDELEQACEACPTQALKLEG